MRRAAKRDENESEVVAALRAVGASVQSLAAVGKGTPDLLVGFRGENYLLEVKWPLGTPSRRKLTPDQVTWHAGWKGAAYIVESSAAALRAIGAIE